ncbi:hypothetical protein C1H46_002563 [Malus baccata]|uniref:Uncharacterized protein n=1 Tax=Malus baccata TaxID=106549 RepID=A0A540NLL4_MALBA|nr:hypothetical protein C1H46_002563 [Malus baccata]
MERLLPSLEPETYRSWAKVSLPYEIKKKNSHVDIVGATVCPALSLLKESIQTQKEKVRKSATSPSITGWTPKLSIKSFRFY